MALSDGVITTIISAGGSGLLGYLVLRRGGKTDDQVVAIDAGKVELEERRVDGEAYERAERFNVKVTDQLSAQLDRMSETLTGLRTDLIAERAVSASARADLESERKHTAELMRHIRSLEYQVSSMQKLLAQAGIPAPIVERVAE